MPAQVLDPSLKAALPPALISTFEAQGYLQLRAEIRGLLQTGAGVLRLASRFSCIP